MEYGRWRRRYLPLYLQKVSNASSLSDSDLLDMTELEEEMPIDIIMMFRSMAEDQVTSMSTDVHRQSHQSGWMTQRLMQFMQLLHPSSKTDPLLLESADENIERIYSAFKADEKSIDLVTFHGLIIELKLETVRLSMHDRLSQLTTLIGQRMKVDVQNDGHQMMCKFDIDEINMVDSTFPDDRPTLKIVTSDHPGIVASIDLSQKVIDVDVYGLQAYPRIEWMKRLQSLIKRLPRSSLKRWIQYSGAMLSTKRSRIISQMSPSTLLDGSVVRLHDPSIIVETSDRTSSVVVNIQSAEFEQKQKEDDVTAEMVTALNDEAFESLLVDQLVYSKWTASIAGVTVSLQSPHQERAVMIDPFSVSGNISCNASILESSLPAVISDWRTTPLMMNVSWTNIITLQSLLEDMKHTMDQSVSNIRLMYDGPKLFDLHLVEESGRVVARLKEIVSTAVDRFIADRAFDISVSYPRLKIAFEDEQSGAHCILTTQVGAIQLKTSQFQASNDVTLQSIHIQDSRQPDRLTVPGKGVPFLGRNLLMKEMSISLKQNNDHRRTEVDLMGIEVNGYPNESGGGVHSNRRSSIFSLCMETDKDESEVNLRLKHLAIGTTFLMRLLRVFVSIDVQDRPVFDPRPERMIKHISHFRLGILESYLTFPLERDGMDAAHSADVVVHIPELSLKLTTAKLWINEIEDSVAWTEISEGTVKNGVVLIPSRRDDREHLFPAFSLPELNIIDDSHCRLTSLSRGDNLSFRDMKQKIHGSLITASINGDCLECLVDVIRLFLRRLHQFFPTEDASKNKTPPQSNAIQWRSSTVVDLDGIQLWMMQFEDQMPTFRIDLMGLISSIERDPTQQMSSLSWKDCGVRLTKHHRQELYIMKSDGLYTPEMMTAIVAGQGNALLGSKESMDDDENGSVSSSTSWQTAGSQLSNTRRFSHTPQTSTDFESVEEGSLYVSSDTHRAMPSLSEMDSALSPRTETEELAMHETEETDNDLDLLVCGAWLISDENVRWTSTNSETSIQIPVSKIAVNCHSLPDLLIKMISYNEALTPTVTPVGMTEAKQRKKICLNVADLHLIMCDVPKLSESGLKDEGPKLQTEVRLKDASLRINSLLAVLDVTDVFMEPSWITCIDPRTLKMKELMQLGYLLSIHGLRCSMQYPRNDVPNGPHNMLNAHIEARDTKMNVSIQRLQPVVFNISQLFRVIELLRQTPPEGYTPRMHPSLLFTKHHCSLTISLQTISTTVVNDSHTLAFPIAEGMLTDVQVAVESLTNSEVVVWDLLFEPTLHLYNRSSRGWEGLMDGPRCDVQGKLVMIQRAPASDRIFGFLAVRMETSSPVEISLTPGMIQSLIGLAEFLKSLKESRARPEEVPFVSFWIRNQTGSCLECSIEETHRSFKVSMGPSEHRPVHVPTITTIIPYGSVRRTTLLMDDFQECDIEEYEVGANASMHRSNIELAFRLSEQSVPCGPLLLLNHGIRRFSIGVDAPHSSIIPIGQHTEPSPTKTTTLACHVDATEGGMEVTLHSEIRLENRTAYRLEIGCWREGTSDPQIVMLETSASFWIPVAIVARGRIALRPSPPTEHRYTLRCTWSQFIELDDIPKGHSRLRIECDPVSGGLKPIWLYLAVSRPEGHGTSSIVIHGPIAIHNFLPVPLDIAVSCDEGKTTSLRGKLNPLTSMQGYTIHGREITNLRLIPISYVSRNISLRRLDVALPSMNQFEAAVDDVMGDEKTVSIADGAIPLRLRRRIEGTSGRHILEIGCSLWIFNCTGHRLALKEPRQDVEDTPIAIEDNVPDRWVVPYAESASPSRSPSTSAVGLQSLLEKGQPERFRLHTGGSSTVGISNRNSSNHASMEILGVSHRPSRLSLRMAGSRAPIGRDYWSEALSVDDDGVTVVKCPNPMHATSTSPPFSDAAYFLAVSTVRIPNSLGATALHIHPRYILRNASRFIFHYRQQGIQMERELPVDVSRNLHWPDANKPLLLGIRIQEAGWMWSGGLRMDTPGDTMIKLRHRVREETTLMQFGVSLRSDGVLMATLSHQSSGFTPYRLDNFTREKLHVRQAGVIAQEDILRPYASMPYAWDEPSGQHRIVLEGTARLSIGTFSLDTIGESNRVQLLPEANDPYCNRIRHLKISIRSEGPTRVLSVVDEDVHPNIQMPIPTLSSITPSIGRFAPLGDRTGIEIQLSLAALGVSLTSNEREMLYARLNAPFMELKQSEARWEAKMSLTGVQLDACLQSAVHPVIVRGPIAPELWTGWMGSSNTALSVQLSIWRRRPGGVICIERCSVNVDPFALNIEERTIRLLTAFISDLLPSVASSISPSYLPKAITHTEDATTMARSMKIYLEELSVSQCHVRISFIPDAASEASQGSFLKKIVSLATFQGAQIRLRPLKLKHPLLSMRALLAVIGQHYTASLLPQLYKIVGSADILGDPVHLLHRLGLGVWLLFANPTNAFVQSKAEPLGVLRGLASGVTALIENVLVGIADAVTKMSQSSRRGLLLAFHLEASLVSDVDLPKVLLEGMVGILSDAADGLDNEGLIGFCRGGIGGIAASIVRPIASTLKIISDIAEGISRSVSGRRSLDPLRLPRHVVPGRSLLPYDPLMSIAAAILNNLQIRTVKANDLQSCFMAEDHDVYFLIAGRSLISARCSSMYPPKFVLNSLIALEDVECIRLRGRSVIVFGCIPLSPWRRRTMMAPAAGPFFVEILQCLDLATACRLSIMLHVVCEKTPKRTAKTGNNGHADTT